MTFILVKAALGILCSPHVYFANTEAFDSPHPLPLRQIPKAKQQVRSPNQFLAHSSPLIAVAEELTSPICTLSLELCLFCVVKGFAANGLGWIAITGSRKLQVRTLKVKPDAVGVIHPIFEA